MIPETTTLSEEVTLWLLRFLREEWSGSLTLHFNRGIVQSYEPKPTIRLTTK